jgi:hypothetical protein
MNAGAFATPILSHERPDAVAATRPATATGRSGNELGSPTTPLLRNFGIAHGEVDRTS